MLKKSSLVLLLLNLYCVPYNSKQGVISLYLPFCHFLKITAHLCKRHRRQTFLSTLATCHHIEHLQLSEHLTICALYSRDVTAEAAVIRCRSKASHLAQEAIWPHVSISLL